MRIGWCGKFEDAKTLADAGFDYLEVAANAVFNGLQPDSDWQAPGTDGLALPVETSNCLLPGELKVVGPQRDMARLRQYIERATARAAATGVEVMVFGGGPSRVRPDDMDEPTAMKQIAEFTAMAVDVAASNGVSIALEHLNRQETNTLNKLGQVLDIVEMVDDDRLGVLVDSYHFGLEDESEETLFEIGDRLIHVHVAEPIDRIEPGGHGAYFENDKAFDFESLFCALRKIGYDRRVSVEVAKLTGPMDQSAASAAKFLRATWEAAGRCEVQ